VNNPSGAMRVFPSSMPVRPLRNRAIGGSVILRMAKEPISIKILIKDAFSGVGPLGWIFILLKPANKGIEMLGEVDLFETYGGAIGRFFDTGMGTFASIVIGTTIIGYAIYKRTHDTTDLRPAPVVTAQPKIPEQQQIWSAGPTADQIAKPETKTAEKQLLTDQEKVRRAEILSKLRNKYPQRIIVDVTPKFLMNLYKDKFAVEGDRAIVPYIGNWLLLSGPLDNVSRTVMFGTEVTFERELGEPFIHMYFDDLWIKRLHVLTPKQNIFALCQLTTAGSATAMFNHCEVIDQDSGLAFSVP
jgi:hypothetical protein